MQTMPEGEERWTTSLAIATIASSNIARSQPSFFLVISHCLTRYLWDTHGAQTWQCADGRARYP